MESIKARLAPRSELGRLFPTYYRDVDLIFLKSRVERPIVHTINILSHIFLGVNADNILSRVGILASRDIWRVDPSFAGWEAIFPRLLPVRDADVMILGEVIDHGFFQEGEIELSVTTDPEQTCALILFGRSRGKVQPVQLSPQTLAFLSWNQLLGFYVPLITLRAQARHDRVAHRILHPSPYLEAGVTRSTPNEALLLV